MVAVVIIHAVMVVCMIYKTKELQTKNYLNLLLINMIDILIESILQYVTMILHLLGFESYSTENNLKKFILPSHTTVQFTSTLMLSF